MIRILLIICFLLTQNSVWSQSLNFSQKKWDFGTIKEEGGDVSHIFEFVNNSKKPIVIVGIRTTCGCTSPKYSRKPIAPDEKSSINVIFDPRFRPGRFSKDITIHTSEGGEPIILTIVGDVTPRELSVSERYPYVVGGDVRISSLYIYMQNVEHNNPKQSQLELLNTSSEPRRVELRSNSPYLKFSEAQTIPSGKQGIIGVTYDISHESGFYGLMDDYTDIYVDGVKSNMTLHTRAFAVDDFSSLIKKSDANGLFNKKIITFGSLKRSQVEGSKSLSIENLGVEELKIRVVNIPAGVNISSARGDIMGATIAPAQRMDLNISLDKSKLELGPYVKYITFILNDPKQPVVRVKVTAEVSE